ncbi:MAG: hypothetical protein JWL77_6020 [Chthonomonadaceae bacterium]|nr:hypothetical protein [Chthonomonadaceae bacterium]
MRSVEVSNAPIPVFPYGTATLRYRLLTGPVDLAPLRVLDSRCILWRGWLVTFFALGASHAVCLERGANSLTELLACAVSEVGAGVLAGERRVEQTTNLCVCAAGLVCEVFLIPFALTEDTGRLQESDPTDRLEFAYPPHSDAVTPYTRIGWRVTAEALHVETVHTYPEEGRGVRSRTVFKEETLA